MQRQAITLVVLFVIAISITASRKFPVLHEEHIEPVEIKGGEILTTPPPPREIKIIPPPPGLFVPATWYVRSDGAASPTCNGHSDASSASTPNCAFADPQEAITDAAIGDTIILQVTNFNLSVPLVLALKGGCDGSAYVTIKSAELSSIPVPTLIRAPMDASIIAHMPTLTTTSGSAQGIFTVAAGAGCYQIQGLKFTDNTAANGIAYVDLSGGGSHFIFDRIAIIPRGYPYAAPNYNSSARIGIIANATDVTVTNSDILGQWGLPRGQSEPSTQIDSEGILTDIGPCNPCTFTRNYIEGGFDPIFLGGADPPATSTATISAGATTTAATLSNTTGLSVGMTLALQAVNGFPNECNHPATPSSLCYGDGIVTSVDHGTNAVTYTALIAQSNTTGLRVPLTTNPVAGGVAQWNGQKIQNVAILNNHIHHVTEFYQSHVGTYHGGGPKAYIEVKFVDGLDYEGNYHDGWYSNFGLASYNQNGGGVWTCECNITVKNNWFNGFNMALSIPMGDPYYLNTKGNNLSATNNLWTNPDNTDITGSDPSSFFISGHYGGNILLDHNTVAIGFPSTYTGANIIWDQCEGNYYGDTGPLTLRNNIMGMGNYNFNGYLADGNGTTQANCWPSLTITKNLGYNNAGGSQPPVDWAVDYPNGIGLSGNGSTVLFVGSNPNVITDWALQPSSPGYRAATDGTDIGVNITTLNAALGGATAIQTCNWNTNPACH